MTNKQTDTRTDQPDDIRKSLNAVMNQLGLTASGWSKRAGLGPNTLASFLKGDTQSIRLSTLKQLADTAGITLNDLLSAKENLELSITDRDLLHMIADGVVQFEQDLGTRLSAEKAYQLLFIIHDYLRESPEQRRLIIKDGRLDISKLRAFLEPLIKT